MHTHIPDDEEYLRGSLLPQFSSWEDQDECVLASVTSECRVATGDVVAIPAFLHGVRQDGYYIAKAHRNRLFYFCTPLSAARFLPGEECIRISKEVAIIPLKSVIFFPDGQLVLRRTVNFHLCAALRRHGHVVENHFDPDAPLAALYSSEWVFHLEKGLVSPLKPKHKRRRIVLDEDSSVWPLHVFADPQHVVTLPEGFVDWEDVDAQVMETNRTYANLCGTGMVGTPFIAIPTTRKGSSRAYVMARIDSYEHGTLRVTVLLSAGKDARGYSHRHGHRETHTHIGVENCFIPLYGFRGGEDAWYTKTGMQDALSRHLSICEVISRDGMRSGTGKCTYVRRVDGHKAEQNRIIANAAKKAGCVNAVVLDSVGYCTASRLLKKTKVAAVYVPNNSTECAEMQQPPSGATLLPGQTLLNAIMDWDVALQGPLSCVVADTCRHFNEDLKRAIEKAFSKFGSRAVLSVTVSTRTESEAERRTTLATVKKFVKMQATCLGFRASEKFMPDVYRNMLFVLFSFEKPEKKDISSKI